MGGLLGDDPIENESEWLVVTDIVKARENLIEP
jgi:hypothetical protein